MVLRRTNRAGSTANPSPFFGSASSSSRATNRHSPRRKRSQASLSAATKQWLLAVLALIGTVVVASTAFSLFKFKYMRTMNEDEDGPQDGISSRDAGENSLWEWYYDYFAEDGEGEYEVGGDGEDEEYDDQYEEEEGDEDGELLEEDPVAAAMEWEQQEKVYKVHVQQLGQKIQELQDKLQHQEENYQQDLEKEHAQALQELQAVQQEQAQAAAVKQKGAPGQQQQKQLKGGKKKKKKKKGAKIKGGGGGGGDGESNNNKAKKKGAKKKKKKKKKKTAVGGL